MPKLIGITGKAGAGKDTIGRMLTVQHWVSLRGEQVDLRSLLGTVPLDEEPALIAGVQMGMADPVKSICHEVYDFSVLQLWGESAHRNAPDRRYAKVVRTAPTSDYGTLVSDAVEHVEYLTPRYALQQLGTQWGRDCWEDTWIALALRRAAAVPSSVPVVVFTDIRFLNEASALKAAGGTLWRVERAGAGLTGVAGTHASEREQDDPRMVTLLDRTFANNGTIAALRAQVAQALDDLRL